MEWTGVSRRSMLRIAGIGGVGLLARGEARLEDQAEEFFPYGAIHMSTIAHWQHYLPPIAEWREYLEKDIARMKQVNFNTLVAHADWYDLEPAPQQFDFSRLDCLVDVVEKNGLRILVWPWPEMQPEWVLRAHPESEWIASDGYKGGSACWDHAGVRGLTERFIERVVTRYRERACVLGWDVGAEAGIWVTSIATPLDEEPHGRLYCYCESTTRRYREWLKRKYGTLGKLNEIWASHYADWSEIAPLRTGVFERAQIFWVDWREFMLWTTTEFQRVKAEAARRVDRSRPITAHTAAWGGGYVHSATDEFGIAKHFDVLSLSFFPLWLETAAGGYHPSVGGLILDGTRCAGNGKPMWIEELQGGPSVSGLRYRSRMPRAEDMRLWAWQCIAHGAKGIFYWNWRPETTGIEASGFGLVNYDGSLTERARAAGEVSAALQKHAGLFKKCRPAAAEIAIFHSPRTFILAAGEGDADLYLRSVKGLYRALWQAGLPADILVSEQLSDLKRYKAVYLPFAYTLSAEEGERLRAYVHGGGALFAELWCGLKDDRTFLYENVPGAGLAEVLHAREAAVNPAEKSAAMKVVKGDAAIPLLEAGAKLPVYKYQEAFETLAGGRVLAQFDDGSPAVVAGEYGAGKSLYTGTLVSRGYAETNDASLEKLIAGFAAWAGVRPPAEVRKDPADAVIDARVMEAGGGRRLVFLFNHGERAATVEAAFAGEASSVTDLLGGAAVSAKAAGQRAKVSMRLNAGEVRILSVG